MSNIWKYLETLSALSKNLKIELSRWQLFGDGNQNLIIFEVKIWVFQQSGLKSSGD